MSLEENKAISIKFYKVFDRQDVEQGQKFMAADIVGHGMDGITRQGVESFMEYAMSMFSAVSCTKFDRKECLSLFCQSGFKP